MHIYIFTITVSNVLIICDFSSTVIQFANQKIIRFKCRIKTIMNYILQSESIILYGRIKDPNVTFLFTKHDVFQQTTLDQIYVTYLNRNV